MDHQTPQALIQRGQHADTPIHPHVFPLARMRKVERTSSLFEKPGPEILQDLFKDSVSACRRVGVWACGRRLFRRPVGARENLAQLPTYSGTD
jgi:hypothetical protein